ncbi:Rv3654c family TadE-like protein [Tessaracoccus sp.]
MRRRIERGVGTVLTAGVCAVLLMVAWTASVLVGWVGQASAAQDAADLASLAGAGAWAEKGRPCEAAGRVAQRNGAVMVACSVSGDPRSFVVEIRVEVMLRPHVPGAPEHVVRTASAGTLP